MQVRWNEVMSRKSRICAEFMAQRCGSASAAEGHDGMVSMMQAMTSNRSEHERKSKDRNDVGRLRLYMATIVFVVIRSVGVGVALPASLGIDIDFGSGTERITG